MKNSIKKIRKLAEPRPWVLESFKTYVLTRNNSLAQLARIALNSLYLFYRKRKNDNSIGGSCSDSQDACSNVRVKASPVSFEEFDNLVLSNEKIKNGLSIDIVIPVYRGYAETSRCLFSVLNAKNSANCEIVVVNDRSPDEKVNNLLQYLSKKGLINLVINSQNLGFVRSMNKGMSLHKDRDVIWLNSDTEVFDGWVDRILEASRLLPNIGSVTSLTNNSTISSYPKVLSDNFSALELSDFDLDNLCSSLPEEDFCIAPTGVGCCMYVSRKALKVCGDLDEVNFGKGYGEENDLCQRFEKAGFLNIISPKVFVRHYGAISFGKNAKKIQKENLIKLLNKHPTYSLEVQKWIRRDPLQKARVKLDSLRLKKKKTRTILHVSHDKGGGTKKFVDSLSAELAKKNIFSLNLVPSGQNSVEIKGNLNFSLFPNIQKFDLMYDRDVFYDFLRLSGIEAIHVHSLIGFPLDFIQTLINLPKTGFPRLVISVHDYHWICPRYDLMPDNRSFCEIRNDEKCRLCSKVNCTSPFYYVRDYFQKVIERAERIIVPSEDTKRRMQSFFPTTDFHVVPHCRILAGKEVIKNQPKTLEQELRIGVLGAIGINKGYEVIRLMGEYIKKNNIPNVKLYVIGFSVDDTKLKEVGIQVSGSYSTTDFIKNYVETHSINALFLPSICPETFSYTLTEALELQIPTLCFNIGAQFERLEQLGLASMTLPYDKRFTPEYLIPAMIERVVKSKRYEIKIIRFDVDNYYAS